jgi:hypothetical protein
LTGTALAHLRHKEKWLDYAQALAEGLSVRRAAAQCGIAKNTSFKWRHRFLSAPATQEPAMLSGIVEAKQTFFVESFKGQRQMSRIARKRGWKPSRPKADAPHDKMATPDIVSAAIDAAPLQIPVLIVRDRHGETADFVVPGADVAQIEPLLAPLLNQDILLCSDQTPAIKDVAQHLGVTSAGLAVEQPLVGNIYHLHNVNAYDGRLKHWMLRFHGVATRYLGNYLGWHRMLERTGQRTSPIACFVAVLGEERRFQQPMAT